MQFHRLFNRPASTVPRRSVMAWLLAGCGAALFGRNPAQAADHDATAQVWVCTYRDCAPYRYDPQRGDPENVTGDAPIPPGTPFEALPHDWICPVCGADKGWFVKEHH